MPAPDVDRRARHISDRGDLTRRFAAGAALVASLTAAVGTAPPVQSPRPGPTPTIVIRDVGIISMAKPGLTTASVVVRDGLIQHVGPAKTIPVSAGVHAIDGRSRFLVPGLIDMHTHVSKTRGSALGLLVSAGVTTVRDMGGDHEELLRWRSEITAGHRVGPRLRIAGPYLESARNADRQHDTPIAEMVEPVERTRIGVANPADADRVVAAVVARGVDHLKIRTTQDRDTYLAIGAAARRHGLRLTGHAQPVPVDDVIAAGQATIEHGFYPSLSQRPATERAAYIDGLARGHVDLVPTLVVMERMGTPSADALSRALREVAAGRMSSAFLLADWREQLAEQDTDRQKVYGQLQASARRDLGDLRAAGVRILAGTDVGVLNVFPGRALHEEIALLVRDAGMTASEALQASTINAASSLGLDKELGTIEAGKRADLVLLDGNPLQDVSQLSRIAAVIADGRLFDRAALDRLRHDVSRAPDITVNDWPRMPAR
jgi:imidazolonepropionase-like amidohydrolase